MIRTPEPMNSRNLKNLALIGWREWLALPDLGIAALKAKIDTGARTSALHALQIEPFQADGRSWVRFRLRPLRKRPEIELKCQAEVQDRRVVTDSGGHREERFVITSRIQLQQLEWTAEITLASRASMMFPMLLGRTALGGRFVVDPARSYTAGRRLAQGTPQAV